MAEYLWIGLSGALLIATVIALAISPGRRLDIPA
jgi:hypothetical protein